MERAQASLQEIADELHYRCGLRVCAATIRRALRALGVARLKPLCRTGAVCAEATKRYGYTAAHRREAILPYSTNLTDAEWELVADLFERTQGQRGTPVRYSRRDFVNACSYVLRTVAHGGYYPRRFHPGRRSTRRFRAGLAQVVYSNRYKTGCANNGVHVWDEQVRQAWH